MAIRGQSAHCRDFDPERLQMGFRIGESDGDAVLLDQPTWGVFTFVQNDLQIERWATSFTEFIAP